MKLFTTIAIIVLGIAGIFMALVMYGDVVSRRAAEEEKKIPWAKMGFLASGGGVLVINAEKYDLKDCSIHQQADGDAWSAYHIDIKAGGTSPPLEPGDFSDGAHPLNPTLHEIKIITAYCQTDHGKVRSGTVVKQPYAK